MGGITLEYLQKLPKTDLHCHLDGSLRLKTILDLAAQQRVRLPAEDPDKLFQLIYPGDECKSLDDYLKAFDITLSVLQTEEALYRAAYELAEDASKENVWYLEVRYAPILHTRRGLRLPSIVEAVIQGLRKGERDFGIRTGVALCGIRSISAEASLRMAELCVAFKNRGVVAFDLAGAEYNCIGHGTRLRENGDLLNYVNDHRIPLEICVSSNIQTRAAADFSSHPLPFYYNYGLRVTINTDNRLVTDTTVSKELWLCHQHYGFTLDDIKELIVSGFKSAFLPYREKADLLKKVTRELEKFQLSPEEQRSQSVHEPFGAAARAEG
jgi:adenosine deaminase